MELRICPLARPTGSPQDGQASGEHIQNGGCGRQTYLSKWGSTGEGPVNLGGW